MKEEKYEILENKIRNLTYIVIIGFVILAFLIVGLYFVKGGTERNSSTTTNKTNTTTTTNYNVSAMKKISGEEAAKLFDEKGTHFLYIGRPGCGVCVNLVPELNKVISDTKMTLYYTELESTYKEDFKNLFGHLDIKTTINEETGTYGKLLEDHGYTPYVIVIKDGKMVDGFVGYRTSENIKTFFNKYM